jgi:hypothetical protein
MMMNNENAMKKVKFDVYINMNGQVYSIVHIMTKHIVMMKIKGKREREGGVLNVHE